MSNFKIIFSVNELQVGQYKTGLFSPYIDGVEISLTKEQAMKFVANYDQYILAEVDGLTKKPNNPVLNIDGLHYCYKLLHDACTIDPSATTSAYEYTEKFDKDDENWDDEEETGDGFSDDDDFDE